VLRDLKGGGREIRAASLVDDVLIALTARSLGATVFTNDASDFEVIRSVRHFSLQVV
jgi:predicted nucleic acid-binding protein